MSHREMGRRRFLQAGAVGLGSLLASRPAWAGANNRVRVAVIGINGMGRNHIRAFSQLPDVDVVAICDVDENLFPKAIEELFVKQGRPKPKTYTDLRKLYEDKDVDAVSIVTPNHWHTLAALWAIQAGKHVYRGEAVLPQHPGGPAARGRREEGRGHRPGRRRAAEQSRRADDGQVPRGGRARRGLSRERALLQVADDDRAAAG